MPPHLKLSRISKALTDSTGMEFAEAEERLARVSVAVLACEAARTSTAGQAALLTALATACKVFRQVVLVSSKDIRLHRPIFGMNTLVAAAKALGAKISSDMPAAITHTVLIGPSQSGNGFAVRCWWDRWHSGVLPSWDLRPLGEDWNPLAGAFSAALAVREIFAQVLGTRADRPRASTVSLWEPWNEGKNANAGPVRIFVPRRLWILGLGHLGQGFLWNLAMLPAHGEMLVLQDYQFAGVENEATGLLTTHTGIGKRKTRVAAAWIERFGWQTELIERKFTNDMHISSDDPPLIICGLDSRQVRLDVLNAGFGYMIDAGVGHGPRDFELSQIRVLAKGDAPSWDSEVRQNDPSSLLETKPYKTLFSGDRCGAFQLAEASVAVPFVGAAVGALSLSQALRLTAMEGTPSLMQVELSAPDCSSANNARSAPELNLGGVPLDLQTGEFVSSWIS